MPLSRREALGLGTLGLVAAILGTFAGSLFEDRTDAAAALQAADFADLTGKTIKLSEWKGKILVCNFWATWCPPCRREIPMLMTLRKDLAPSGVEVVGIAVDSVAKVVEFSRRVQISYPVLIALGDGLALMRELGNTEGGLPYTVVLRRDGSIGYRKLGELSEAVLRTRLRALLEA